MLGALAPEGSTGVDTLVVSVPVGVIFDFGN